MRIFVSAIALFLFSSEASFAQSNEEPITSLTVQGATVPEPLQELPISASVYSAPVIAEKNAVHFQDLIDSTPGLSAAGGSNRERFFQIRGIGELEQYEGAPNPSVGIRIDDIDLSGIGGVGSLFDIDQVEILRGPQPLRYGANALAGIINIRSKDPTPYFTGTGTVSLANDEYTAVGAALGGPLLESEALQFRASVYNLQQNGFRNNVYLSRDDTNGRDETTARLKLRALPSSDLTVDLNSQILSANNGYDAFTIDNDYKTESDRPGEDSQFTGASALKVRYDLNKEVSMENLLTYSRSSIDYSYDGDWGNNPFWGQYAPYDYFSDTDRVRRSTIEELKLFSNELGYSHGETARWVVGAYLERLQENASINQFSDNAVYDALGSAYTSKTYALYGQYEQPLQKGTALSAGLRVDQRDSEYDDSRGNNFSPEDTMYGGLIALTHDVSEATRTYLLASRGFKGGGFNVGTSTPADKKQFDPEYLWNLETGVKSNFADNSVTTNLSAYSMFRRDQQIKLAIQTDPNDPLTFSYVTDNAARGWNVGTEGDIRWLITPQATLFLAGSLLDTRLTSVPTEDEYLRNRAQSAASPWQYNLGGKYAFTENVFTRLEVVGRDAFYFDDSHNEKSDPYNLLNATIGYQQDRWSVSLWGKNILDKNYATRGFFFGDEPPNYENKRYVQLADRALFGITVGYTF